MPIYAELRIIEQRENNGPQSRGQGSPFQPGVQVDVEKPTGYGSLVCPGEAR